MSALLEIPCFNFESAKIAEQNGAAELSCVKIILKEESRQALS
ncbi:MAG TPA: hypothetical protein VI757_03580 [Bacteroidia bacterium]|nr:hypothetical protein [Bacteroidia bacterium]